MNQPIMDGAAVRIATPADLPGFKAVIDGNGLFPPDMLDDMSAPFFAGAENAFWLTLATDGPFGRPLGLAYCEAERMTAGTWNLLLIALAPERQRSGGGGALLARVEAEVLARGGSTLLVETSHGPDQAGARAFYLKHGFVEEARIRDFYQPGEHKVVYWKAIGR